MYMYIMWHHFHVSLGVTDAVQSAATFALVVGSALHEEAAVPNDNQIITSFVNSAVSIQYVSTLD